MFHSLSDLISSPLHLSLMLQPHWHWFLSRPQTQTHFCLRAFELDAPFARCSLPTNTSMAQSHFLQTLFSSPLTFLGRSFLISLYKRATYFLIYSLFPSFCFTFLQNFYYYLTYYISNCWLTTHHHWNGSSKVNILSLCCTVVSIVLRIVPGAIQKILNKYELSYLVK